MALARACLVSERTLLGRLRATLGTTPERRLRELRTERARQLLESSSLPIATVAERCGYASAAAFRRAFHEGGGTSPSDCRRRLELMGTRPTDPASRAGASSVPSKAR